jgi:hypothetical protein
MQITLTENIQHDGVNHVPGDVLDVSDEQGQSLVDAGVAKVEGGGQSTASPLGELNPPSTTDLSQSAPVGPEPSQPQQPVQPSQPAPTQPTPEQIARDMAVLDGPSLN